MALGARTTQIAKAIMTGLRMPLLAGLLLGTAGSMAWDGAYSAGVAGVYASAPPTLLRIAGFIVALVIASCFIPLRRATRMNPVSALTTDSRHTHSLHVGAGEQSVNNSRRTRGNRASRCAAIGRGTQSR
jgi:hypothetical protein